MKWGVFLWWCSLALGNIEDEMEGLKGEPRDGGNMV
jgi:hypothetical protein